MSVINKMLQDLESREATSEIIGADYQPSAKKSNTIRLIIWLLVALVVGIYGAYTLFVEQKLTTASEDSHELNKVATPTPKKMQMAVLAPVMPTANIEQPIIEITPVAEELATELDIPPPISSESQQVVIQTPPMEIETPVDETPTASFSMNNSGQGQQIVDLKQRISELLANDKNQQAMTLLVTLLQNEPANIKARKKLAALYFAQGNSVQARMLLTDSIQLFPELGDLKLMLARVYQSQNDTRLALTTLLTFEPQQDIAEYLAYRAGIARQLKELSIAKQDYQSLVGMEPNNGKWWLGLGLVEDQLGHAKQAVNAYQNTQHDMQLDNAVKEFVKQRISILSEPR